MTNHPLCSSMLKSIFNISFLAFAALMLGYAVTMGVQISPAGASPWDYTAQDNGDYASSADLHPATKNGIAYLTGGIGDAERAEIESHRHDYNFHLMLATLQGGFVGDASVSISDAKGNVLPETDSGPLFYATLPPGAYTVSIAHDNAVKKLKIVINQGKPVYVAQAW
ncbi:MAG: T9SS type A sorting domain-containing protein [Alphaproteobacteria bacterium]|nr:T9SS type A sorting domain-containing protein [Alphaproteobacteria bacterium]